MISGGAFHLGTRLGLHRVVEAAPDATGRQHCSLAAQEKERERERDIERYSERDRAQLRCSSGLFRHTPAGRCTKSSRQAFDGILSLESWPKLSQASVRRGSKARPWTSPRPTRKSAPPPFLERTGTICLGPGISEFQLPGGTSSGRRRSKAGIQEPTRGGEAFYVAT